MAGTVAVTENPNSRNIQKVKFAWTSDASGNADGTTVYAYDGKCELFYTDPDGTNAPTDNYDIAIVDDDGVDVLAQAGADRDTATNEKVLGSSLGAVASSKLTIHVTNAGNAKQGIAWLYVRCN